MNAYDEDSLQRLLVKLGLVEFEVSKLRQVADEVKKTIDIGIRRLEEPNELDGGVLAFDSLITPHTQHDLRQVNEGTRVLVGNFGGTNWRAGWAEKLAHDVLFQVNVTKSFQQHERSFTSPEEFVEKIVDMLIQGSEGTTSDTVAISFGFRHTANLHACGLDALVPVDDPAKYWHVRGLANKSMIDLIIEVAKWRSWDIKQVFITNDTVATALDLPGSLGFVAGSGTNGCLAVPQHKQGHLLNLESGRISAFPMSNLIHIGQAKGVLVKEQTLSEYYTGGDFIIRLFQVAVGELAGFIRCRLDKLSSADASVVSLIASGQHTTVEQLLEEQISDLDFDILVRVAGTILNMAGQVIGVVHTAMSEVCGEEGWQMGVEGSVFWKGYGVKDKVDETVVALKGERIQYKEVIGARGIARYAMEQSQGK